MIPNIKMELINQIDETICFNENNIRVIGTYNEPYFVAKDVCNILELKDVSNALLNIPEKWKGTKVISTPGGKQDMRIINEAGLYKLIMRSNKPIAQKFQEAVCEDILPSLRRKGEYKIQNIIDKNKKLEDEKQKILEEKKDLEEDLKLKDKDLKFKKYLLDKSEIEKKQLEVRLEKKERVKYEHTNSVYIISNPTIKPVIYGKSSNNSTDNNSTDNNSNNNNNNTTHKKRKKKKKYFKLGKSSDRNSRLSNYCAGAPLDYVIEYSRPLCSKREESVIENLLLIIFDSYRVVNEIGSKREWVENIELDVLKNEMDLLVDFLETRKQFHDSKYVPLSKEVLSKKNNHIENKKLDESDYEEEDDDFEEEKYDDDFEEEKYDDDEKGDDFVEENYENKKGHDFVEEKYDDDEKGDDFVEENYENKKGHDFVEENYENKKGDDDFVEENYDDEEENHDDDVEEENDIVEKEVILDPRDFDKFIADYCEVGENFFEPKSDLRSAHRVWSNCTFKDVKKDFENYLIKNFKSGAQFIDNSRRNVYRGLRLKKITFTPSKNNYDYEQFIAERCKVEHQNRIGYADFYKYFEEYKKETDPKYKLTGTYKAEIKKYLQSKFNPGRVYVSKVDKSGGLRGVWGIGHAKNNFGLKELKRKNKQVGQFDSKTNKLLNTYDSMILGSKTLNIPFSSFSHYIHSQAIYDGKIYKFI
jgi:prophage antirepressor-like protein